MRRRHAPEKEGAHVLLDGDAIQQDRLHQGSVPDRHQPKLPGKAKHHHVGEDRIAHKGLSHAVGIHRRKMIASSHSANRLQPTVDGEIGIAPADDVAGGHGGKVHCRLHAGAIGGRRLGR